MNTDKELHYCETCQTETWFTLEEVRRRGSICPNGCLRNFLVYLGSDEKEISKRRKEFLEKKGFDFEPNPDYDSPDEFEEKSGHRRREREEDTINLGFKV